jgi:type VII secretion-associated serine protease mycosin
MGLLTGRRRAGLGRPRHGALAATRLLASACPLAAARLLTAARQLAGRGLVMAGAAAALLVLSAAPQTAAPEAAAPQAAAPRGATPQTASPLGRVQGVLAQVRAAERAQLKAIDVNRAWRVSRGRGVTVAVLDTGVAAAADLSGAVTSGPDYTIGANPPGYRPPHLHGTFIASLIAGHGSGPGRAGGVIGVAPAARILSVRVILDDQEPGIGDYTQNSRSTDAIDRGIRYAARHGARVINMSLGAGQPTRDMQSAIGYAESRGIVVVASAGNSGARRQRYTPYSYPASFPGVISVGAVNAAGARAPFSDHNSSVVLSAPGVNIIGAGPGGSYLQADGTSPAAAFVSGVAALIRSAYPRLDPVQVAQALVSSTRHRPPGRYSPSTGFGEVDAAAALRAARSLASARPVTALAAGRHFGGTASGPVVVVRHDTARVAVLAAVGAAGILGFLLTVVMLSVMAVRARRRAAPGPGPGTETGM